MPDVQQPETKAFSGNPFLEGNFAPVEVETTAFNLPVEGQIPEELEGRLLRIGPNPVSVPDPKNYHWFMGPGMAHGLRLRGGKAEWYRNRYVVSESIAPALGRPNLPGPTNGDRDNMANTNILDIGGQTYAIVEAGSLPVELSYDLDSVARSNLNGGLKHGFAPHPKYDPLTGEYHAMAYQPGLSALSYVVVGRDGLARTVAEIDAPHCPMVHDMAFTATYAIVLDLPVVFDPSNPGFRFSWDARRTPRIGLVPRNGDLAGMRWVEAPSCFVFHVMNAFDDGDAVVMDVVRHPRIFDRSGPGEGEPRLVRWRLDLASGKLRETVLEERGCEFPRFNTAYAGREYRFGYTTSIGAGDRTGPAYKHDVTTARTERHDYGPGRVTLEPVFVPRQGAVAEDDGWVMSYVYDGVRDASDVVILDARHFAGNPVATIRLPVRVPFGFHGNWVADRG